jgi:hypothetical protein
MSPGGRGYSNLRILQHAKYQIFPHSYVISSLPLLLLVQGISIYTYCLLNVRNSNHSIQQYI